MQGSSLADVLLSRSLRRPATSLDGPDRERDAVLLTPIWFFMSKVQYNRED
jgi:hypothetical protein